LVLLKKAQSGDETALENLLGEVRPLLKKVVREIGVTATDVSDVVQEELLKIWQHIEKRNVRAASNAELVGWLTTVAENGALTALRDAQRQKRDVRKQVGLPQNSSGSVLLADAGSTPSQQAVRRELEQRRDAALSHLPADYQQVLRLRRYEWRDWHEIAATMGRTESAVRRLYYRARQRWKQAVEESHG